MLVDRSEEPFCDNTAMGSDPEETECLLSDDTETSPSLRNKLKNSLVKLRDVEKRLFKFDNLSDTQVKDYTNITKAGFRALNAVIDRFRPLKYWSGFEVCSISDKDQLFICLMKLKLDLPLFDLAVRYGVSRTTIHNIFMTYLLCMYEIMYKGMLNKIPSLSKHKGSLPDPFGDFTNCRIIIDCTEFRIVTPGKDLNAAALSYSSYKHFLTGKFLIGVAPNRSITFVSDGYAGSTSGKEVTQACGVLSHMKAGDLVLADKGFLPYDVMPKGVSLNLTAFLASKSKLTKAEAVFSRKIARSRIHVERALERMRNYRILESFQTNLRPFVSMIVQVCAALVNLQSSVISGVLNQEAEGATSLVPL